MASALQAQVALPIHPDQEQEQHVTFRPWASDRTSGSSASAASSALDKSLQETIARDPSKISLRDDGSVQPEYQQAR